MPLNPSSLYAIRKAAGDPLWFISGEGTRNATAAYCVRNKITVAEFARLAAKSRRGRPARKNPTA